MNRWKRKFCSLILTVAMLLSVVGVFPGFAEEGVTVNRYNVVFVIDASGSMKSTDSSLLRFDAIDLFLGVSADAGNHMGAVVFNDGIVSQIDLKEMSSKDMKNALSQSLRESAVTGDTDIGGAVKLATDMLDANRNTSLPSVIILLSDGNTDFPSDSTGTLLQQSNANKQAAIEAARQNGYQVFSVCLNANQKANTEELADYANATGGQFVEVQNAEDLKEVFQRFYDIINATKSISIADQNLPDSGLLDIPFSVPAVGVEELNIIISTLSPDTQYTLFQPNGIAYTAEELNTMTSMVKTFSIIKIPKPAGGTWKIQARGIPGDAIKIDMVYNSNFSIQASVTPEGGSYGEGDAVTFKAKVLADGKELTEGNPYAVYQANLSIRRTADDSEMAGVIMKAGQQEYNADVTLNESGDFYGVVTVNFDGGLEKTSERIPLSVGGVQTGTDNPPQPADEPVQWKAKADKDKSYASRDLQSFASDSEDAELTFSISDPGAYGADQLYIEDGMLKVEMGGFQEGNIRLTAQDSVGQTCEVQVEITKAANIGGLIIKIVGILLALGILGALIALLIKKGKKPVFQGDVMLNAFDINAGFAEAPQTIQPVKGKEALSRYIVEGGGVDLNKTFLMADSSPDFIWLVSNGLYSSDNPDKKEKKIRLYSGMEMTVSPNRDLDSGLQITYNTQNLY